MSRQPQMVQGEASIKRQILAIVILTGLVFGVWWSFMGIYDMFYGGSRGGYQASENLDENSGGKFGLYRIPMATFPDIDFGALAEYLTPEQLQELLDLLGGNLDNLDPSLLADLLGADPEALATVMFRVYDYLPGEDIPSWLFRYSVYDSFAGDDWSKTEPAKLPSVYQNNRVPPDVTPEYRLRIPLGTITPNEEYSVTVPCVSPDTSIQQNTVTAQTPSLDWNSVQMPYVDEYGMKYLKPIFTTSDSQNISLHTWGFQRAGGSLYYNVTTRSTPSIISASIRSRYLTFPGGASASVYAASRPNFAAVVAAVQTRMNTNPSANLFVKANMIRNYIQESFARDPFTASQAADIVEDTCEKRVGDYYALTSTYVMLARYFEIPARFVMGYSGYYTGETSDPTGNPSYSGPANTIEMKLSNMYAWAETFMPVQDDGTGDWVSMDVVQESFEDGVSDGNPVGEPLPEDTVMRMFVNGTESGMSLYSVVRPTLGNIKVNITVNVTVAGTAYNGPVTLYDLLEEQTLGVITAVNGRGELLWNINTTVLAGGHGIRGTAGSLMNFTGVGVRGNLNLVFESRTPETIYATSPNQDLRVVGYLQDPAYTGARSNTYIPKANITVGVYTDAGCLNPVLNPFSPGTVKTNETGQFATNITRTAFLLNGAYYVRLNFYGMFTFTQLGVGQASFFVEDMQAISVTRNLNVNDPTQVVFHLYVAGNDYTQYTTPVTPNKDINLSAYVNRGGTPLNNELVYFDYKNAMDSENPITSIQTNAFGWANYSWLVPFDIPTGPVVIRARFWDSLNGVDRFDHVYGVVNRSIDLGFSGALSPTAVNLNVDTVTFIALLNDTQNLNVRRAQIRAVILDSSGGLSNYYFTPSSYGQTDISGLVPFSDRITGSGAFTTYYVDLWFNQTFNFNIDWFAQTHTNPGLQPVPWFDSDNAWQRAITILDPSDFRLPLWINGTATKLDGYTDANRPRTYTNWQQVELKVQALQSGLPLASQTIQFFDISGGTSVSLGTNTTNVSGYSSIKVPVNPDTFTGPHHLRAFWVQQNRENFTVAFVNGSTTRVELDPVTQTTIIRGVTTLSVTGRLLDAQSQGIYRGQVNLVLLSSTGGYIGSGYFTGGATTVTTSLSGGFTFNVLVSNTLHYGDYNIRVDFNRTIDAWIFNPCWTYLTSASNLLVDNSSTQKSITVNASVQFLDASYNPLNPEGGGTITVSGYIRWDNGTALDTSYKTWINVTVYETANPAHNFENLVCSSIVDGYLSMPITVTWELPFSVKWVFTSSVGFVASTSQVATGEP